MKIPGRKLVGKAEETANVIGVPMTRGLGFADLLKRTFKEAWKDHLDVFAGLDSLSGTLAEALRGDTRQPLPDLHARPIMHYILTPSRA